MEAEYPNTVLHFGEGGSIDLREPLAAQARAVFAHCGLGGSFAILSAYPAPDERRAAAESEARTRRLRAVIAAFDVDPVDVLASSVDGRHREPSLAAALERRDALGIARLFQQAAQFWFDGEHMWIDWTDGRAPTRLPVAPARGPFRIRGLRSEVDESGAH
jgi:hypothetical protein